jgi:hypothetical protein
MQRNIYDRRGWETYLEKGSHGQLRNGTMKQESRIARDQEELNEDHIYMRNSQGTKIILKIKI